MLTDLGIELAALVTQRREAEASRSSRPDRARRLLLLSSIFGSFLVGAGIAAAMLPRLGRVVLARRTRREGGLAIRRTDPDPSDVP